MPKSFYKKLGETSFRAIERFREEHPEYADETIAFAGRLDPMAEGEMLFLLGDEAKRASEFLGMDKEYETEFIFGIDTDSFDLMGLIKEVHNTQPTQDAVRTVIEKHVGKQMQKFPPFSKRHVQGKALFVWASEGRLDEITIPEHEVEIYSITIDGFATRTFGDIRDAAISRISDVVGDFRQEKIIEAWRTNQTSPDTVFMAVTLTVRCGTGTYIRQLAHDIGQELGCGALAYSIKRTKILKKEGTSTTV